MPSTFILNMYYGIHTYIRYDMYLQVSGAGAASLTWRGLSVTEAIDACMIPLMEEEEVLRFTPREVLLYQHAQDRRYIFGINMV